MQVGLLAARWLPLSCAPPTQPGFFLRPGGIRPNPPKGGQGCPSPVGGGTEKIGVKKIAQKNDPKKIKRGQGVTDLKKKPGSNTRAKKGGNLAWLLACHS